MDIKKIILTAGLGLALTIGAVPSFAGVQLWAFQDDDIDFLLDGETLQLKTTDAGMTIEVGDVLVSAFEFPTWTIDGANAIPRGKELTGIAAIQLVDITGSQWTFAPYGGGGLDPILASILGDATRLAGQAGNGSMLAMWLNNTDGVGGDQDLILDAAMGSPTGNPNCTSLSDCIDQATLGELIQVDGFLDDPDEFWVGFDLTGGLATNIDSVWKLGIGTNVFTANVALSTFYNIKEPVLFQDINSDVCAGAVLGDSDGCVNVRGFVTIVGGKGIDSATGAFAHSDANATKYVVPEPTLLALMGLGLLGFGASLKKRKA